MNSVLQFIDGNGPLINEAGFYLFFTGFLLLIAVIVPLLLEKERFIIPSIVFAMVFVGISAVALEKKKSLFSFLSQPSLTKVVTVTNTVTKEVRVEVPVEVRVRDRAPLPGGRVDNRAAPAPRVVISGGGGDSPRVSETIVRSAQPAAQPAAQPTAQPAAQPAPHAAPQPVATTAPAPVAVRAVPAPSNDTPPARAPDSGGDDGGGGMLLPTGNLIIQVEGTLLMVVPAEATKARLNVYIGGKYVGGKGASSLKRQKDDAGNVLNVTYLWNGITVRLMNQELGNKSIVIKLSVSGNGVSESAVAWSGSVKIEEGTKTVVLKGGWGTTLTRVQ